MFRKIYSKYRRILHASLGRNRDNFTPFYSSALSLRFHSRKCSSDQRCKKFLNTCASKNGKEREGDNTNPISISSLRIFHRWKVSRLLAFSLEDTSGKEIFLATNQTSLPTNRTALRRTIGHLRWTVKMMCLNLPSVYSSLQQHWTMREHERTLGNLVMGNNRAKLSLFLPREVYKLPPLSLQFSKMRKSWRRKSLIVQQEQCKDVLSWKPFSAGNCSLKYSSRKSILPGQIRDFYRTNKRLLQDK